MNQQQEKDLFRIARAVLKWADVEYEEEDLADLVMTELSNMIEDDTKQSITIPMTESDCEEVMRGAEFHWTFPDQNGKDISVTIRAERESDNE